jgi:hypothetical protein
MKELFETISAHHRIAAALAAYLFIMLLLVCITIIEAIKAKK